MDVSAARSPVFAPRVYVVRSRSSTNRNDLFKNQSTPAPADHALRADFAGSARPALKIAVSTTLSSPILAAMSNAPHWPLPGSNACLGATLLKLAVSPLSTHCPTTCHASLTTRSWIGEPVAGSPRLTCCAE